MTLVLTVNGAARLAAATTKLQDIDSARLGSGNDAEPVVNAEGLSTRTAVATPITGATLGVAGVVKHDGNDVSFIVEYDGAITWANANEIILYHGTEDIAYGSALDSAVYAHPHTAVRLAVGVGITLTSSIINAATFGELRYVIEQLGVDGLTLDNSVTGATQIAVAAAGQDPSKKTSLSNAVGKTIEGATEAAAAADDRLGFSDTSDSGNLKRANVDAVVGAGMGGAISAAAEATPANDDKIPFSDTSDGGALKRADLSDMGAGLIPAGVIWDFAGATPPTGWLLCDGSVVSRTTYAALFGVIGTAFGAGDGSSTFNLPNASGRVLGGAGGALGARGASVGAAGDTLAAANMPLHNHPHEHSVDYYGVTGEGSGAVAFQRSNRFASAQLQLTTDRDSTNAGNASPTPISRIQPTLVVNKIIKI